ncbi:MAG TPA: SgcJ/EcaC family oxidoreductase, partial [Casimicrobiaceae bacterium]|nr:SgcJ/EcaC family oxidoreductase [Casimicrobiaceae bacterium]
MTAKTPEDTDRQFAQALNAGRIDDLVALYEPQATLMASPGKLVTGTVGIREALARFVAAKPKMSLAPKVVAQSGDLAVVTAKWELAMTGPDGKPANMTGQSVEVVRRQTDGRWLFV